MMSFKKYVCSDREEICLKVKKMNKGRRGTRGVFRTISNIKTEHFATIASS